MLTKVGTTLAAFFVIAFVAAAKVFGAALGLLVALLVWNTVDDAIHTIATTPKSTAQGANHENKTTVG